MGQRFKLTIAYDGRPFDGWQSQTAGNTIQDAIQDAIAALIKSPIQIHGAGRTDAGVHALGQVAHFDAPDYNSMTAKEWQRAIHTKLPPSIRILEVQAVPTEFHSRYSSKRKTYRYELDVVSILAPLRVGLAWHVYYSLNEELLREAVGLFQGKQDFANLSAKRRGKEIRTTVRTIYQAQVDRIENGYALTFEGDGFLYKMVRMMVGAAVDCARGKEPLSWIRSMLENPQGTQKSSISAPADGLYLVSVDYDSSSDAV